MPVSTIEELRLELTRPGRRVLTLAPLAHFRLGGTPLNVSASADVTIFGSDATLDGEELSRVIEVTGGLLVVHNLQIVGGSSISSGGCVLVDHPEAAVSFDGVVIERCSTTRGGGGGIAVNRATSVNLTASSIFNTAASSDATSMSLTDGGFGGGVLMGGWFVGNVRLEGVTIRGCTASAQMLTGGGGVAILGGSVSLIRSTIANTSVTINPEAFLPSSRAPGGGIAVMPGGSLTLESVIITHTAARAPTWGDTNGGGLSFTAGRRLAVRNSLIEHTVAHASGAGTGSQGGGIAVTCGGPPCDVQIVNTTIANARVSAHLSDEDVAQTAPQFMTAASGGGLNLNTRDPQGVGLTLSDVALIGCVANASGWSTATGGGILIAGGATLTRLTFTRCVCSSFGVRGAMGGGLWKSLSGELVIADSTFTDCLAITHGGLLSQHSALAYAGGIGADGGSLLIMNSTVRGARSTFTGQDTAGGGLGGGLAVVNSGLPVLMENATIADCDSTNQGGGVFMLGGSLIMSDGTQLIGNTAGGGGASIFVGSGIVAYRAPLTGAGEARTLVAPGRWIYGQQCQIFRRDCPLIPNPDGPGNIQDLNCTKTMVACQQDPNVSAFVDGMACTMPQFYQPCNWELQPSLVGHVVQTLPVLQHVEEDFPFGCARGFFTVVNGALCLECPAHSTTFAAGTASVDGCYCEAGFLAMPPVPESVDEYPLTATSRCIECPKHAQCLEVDTSLQDLTVDPGFWRVGYNSLDVKRCPRRSVCAGGLAVAPAYNRSSSSCALGRGVAGVFCLLCERPQSDYFDTSQERCRPCEESIAEAIALAVLLVCGLAFILLVWQALPRHVGRWQRHLAINAERVSFQAKLRLTITFLQVLTQMQRVYDVRLPEAYSSLVDAFQFVNLDWVNLVNARCLGLRSLSMRLRMMTWVPLAATVAAPLVTKLCGGQLVSALPAVLWWTFLLFPSVCPAPRASGLESWPFHDSI